MVHNDDTEAGIQWVARTGDFRFLGPVAASRGRLWTAAAVGSAINVGFAMGAEHFVMRVSGSVGLNLALIAVQFLLLMTVGYVLACALGASFWGEMWRRRALMGERISEAAVNEDEVAAASDDHVFGFWVLLGVAFAVTYLGSSLPTDFYVQRYNQWGYFATMLRSDLPDAQIEALRGIVHPANPNAPNVPLIRESVQATLASSTGDVQAWAAWTAGRMLLREARGELLALLDPSTEAATFLEASLAIGQLRDGRGEARLLELLGQADLAPAHRIAVMRGLGEARSRAGGQAIAALLPTLTGDLQLWALWTLGRLGYDWPAIDAMPGWLREPVLSAWVQTGDADECRWAETLKHVTTVADLDAMQQAFERTLRGVDCAEVRFEDRAETDEHPRWTLVVVGEPLAAKYMKAAFNIGAPGVGDWVRAVRNTPEYPESIRLEAQKLIEAMDINPVRSARQ
jgi:hypothetical protein